MRQKTHATSPRHLGLAEGQKWHHESGQLDAHSPRDCLQNRGQIARRVVVQRPRAQCASRSPEPSGADREGDGVLTIWWESQTT